MTTIALLKASRIRVYSLFVISGIIPRAPVHPAEFCKREATHTGLVEELHCTCHISSGNHCFLVDGQNQSDGGPTSCVHKVCGTNRTSITVNQFFFLMATLVSKLPVNCLRPRYIWTIKTNWKTFDDWIVARNIDHEEALAKNFACQ